MATLKQVSNGLEYSFTEPSTTATGTPLNDLKETVIFEDIGAGDVQVQTVPASSPVGGQVVTVVIPNLLGANSEGDVTVSAICVDLSGNQSDKGAIATVRADTLPPAPPV